MNYSETCIKTLISKAGSTPRCNILGVFCPLFVGRFKSRHWELGGDCYSIKGGTLSSPAFTLIQSPL